MQQVLQSTKDNIMYCMISIKDSDRPEILKIQGVTWFETYNTDMLILVFQTM